MIKNSAIRSKHLTSLLQTVQTMCFLVMLKRSDLRQPNAPAFAHENAQNAPPTAPAPAPLANDSGCLLSKHAQQRGRLRAA